MKHIVIFFDGTAFRSDSPRQSNVLRLCMATERRSSDGVTQLLFYHRGVGSGIGTGKTSRFVDKVLGGAFASGLGAIIEEAYREVVLNYEAGDRLFLFGWSRGAFAARRLVDVLRKIGMVEPCDLPEVTRLVGLELSRVKGPESGPWTEQFLKVRRDFSRAVATSRADLHYRQSHGQNDAVLLDLAYMGLWDCVAAIGLPVGLNNMFRINAHLEDHDDLLSSMVQSMRHAVALDETSVFFPPKSFSNLTQLNESNGYLSQSASEMHPFQQKFFPGGHASVGGASPHRAIGDASLRWIAEGAEAAGLFFDKDLLELPDNHPVTLEEARSVSGGLFGWGPLQRRRRHALEPGNIMPQAVELMNQHMHYWPEFSDSSFW